MYIRLVIQTEVYFMKLKALAVFALVVSMAVCTVHAQSIDAEVDAWKKTLPEANADYGRYPNGFAKTIKLHLSKTLKDPESVKYGSFSKPRKEHIIENALKKQAIYGYAVCVSVNAKNSYGGYAGNHQFWFFIKDGQIVRSQDVDSGPLGEIIYQGHPINCEDGESL